MNKKLFIVGLILSVISILFIYNKFYYKTIDFSKYDYEMLRFNLQLQDNYYNLAKDTEFGTNSANPTGKDNKKPSLDKVFENKSKKVYLHKKSIKYGEYLFSENDGEYLHAKIGNNLVWIKHKISINEKYRCFIKNFIISNKYSYSNNNVAKFANITPFNDSRFALIYAWHGTYIVDLENEKIMWQTAGYYESPHINFKTGLMECGGDLSGKTYVFDKFGNLIKTIGW